MTAGASTVPEETIKAEEAKFPQDRILEFPRTDSNGSRLKFPTNTREELNRDGIYDFMKPLSRYQKIYFDWRRKIGTYIALEVLHKPSGSNDMGYILKDFPQGYEFYDHHKGPPGKVRHDVYLFGPDNSQRLYRFRSTNEFLPHARWLFDVGSDEPCRCKYCSGSKSQKEISAALGVRPLKSESQSGSPTKAVSARPIRPRPSTVRGARNRIPEQEREPKPAMLPELFEDVSSNRIFRKGEAVWAALEEPIRSIEDPSLDIIFWPGLVVGYHFQPQSSTTPNCYKVQHFCSSQSQIYNEDRVLPHRGFMLNKTLKAKMEMVRFPPNLFPNVQDFLGFRPLRRSMSDLEPSAELPTFDEALLPYTWAVYIALYVNAFFLPVGHWEASAGSDDVPRSYFQGLFLGPEKFWLGDVVRVKPESGAYPEQARVGFMDNGDDIMNLHTTSSNPAFCRLECITIDKDKSGIVKCSVAGTMYEAVDEAEPFSTPDANMHTPQRQPFLSGTSEGGAQSSKSSFLDFTHRDLPPPPPKKVWNQLSSTGKLLRFSAELIAGRYYPTILSHPLIHIDPTSPGVLDYFRSLQGPTERTDGVDMLASHLSLAGLEKGWMNCSFTSKTFLDSRAGIMQSSEQYAAKHLVPDTPA